MKTEREKELVQMLREANEVLRSFSAVCDREGASTNWQSLKYEVRRVLAAQHQFMHPEQYTGPRAG